MIVVPVFPWKNAQDSPILTFEAERLNQAEHLEWRAMKMGLASNLYPKGTWLPSVGVAIHRVPFGYYVRGRSIRV